MIFVYLIKLLYLHSTNNLFFSICPSSLPLFLIKLLNSIISCLFLHHNQTRPYLLLQFLLFLEHSYQNMKPIVWKKKTKKKPYQFHNSCTVTSTHCQHTLHFRSLSFPIKFLHISTFNCELFVFCSRNIQQMKDTKIQIQSSIS